MQNVQPYCLGKFMTVAAIEVILLFSTITLFTFMLAVITILLTLRRRQRAKHLHDRFVKTVAIHDTQEHQRVVLEDTQPVRVYAAPLAPEWRLPVREGSPDQVVISIEPDPGPTLRQSAVQRLITFLKQQPSAKVG